MAKFIIVGLGNFGSALSAKLTELGHEVVGVDNSQSKVEMYKDRITHTIMLDATDPVAIKTLPLKEADVVIVTIGEDFGASVLVTAILKKLNVKRLIGRGISELHKTVLESLQVDEIIMPEEDAATRLAKSLDLKGVIDSLQLSENYSIIEITVPNDIVGKKVSELDLRNAYNLNIVTIKRSYVEKGIMGERKRGKILGVISADTKLQKGDLLVLFGTTKDIERFIARHD